MDYLPDKLKKHPFLDEVWREAAQLQKRTEEAEKDGKADDIDEYQFYVLRVGYYLAQLVTWMEQLDHAVFYLSDFSYKREAKDRGITRAQHLLYTVENYLIRLQSVHDRCLQLTNNIFHLGIEDSNVGHSVIVSNIKVSRTEVANSLRAMRKAVQSKAEERHRIIHRESYRDDDLRRLELFYMFDKDTWEEKPGEASFENFQHVRQDLLRRTVSERKAEFSEINERVFEQVHVFLDALSPQYAKERGRIHLYVYGSGAHNK